MPQTRTFRIQSRCINNLIKLNLPSIPHTNSTEPTNQLTFVENIASSLALKITGIPSITTSIITNITSIIPRITSIINASNKGIRNTESLYKQFNQT